MTVAALPLSRKRGRPSAHHAEGPPFDRRQQIAGAAAGLFAEYGFEATTMRQLAERVGMLAGSLYNHFATKEDLLHAVMRARLGHMEHANERIARFPVDAEHKLLANAIMRISEYVEHAEFHTILLRESKLFQRHPDFAYVVAAKARIREVQQGILREGMDAGLFRAEMDPYLMIGTISRMLSGVSEWYRSIETFSSSSRSPYTLDALVDFHFDCLLRLVRASGRLAEPVPRARCEQLLELHLADNDIGPDH